MAHDASSPDVTCPILGIDAGGTHTDAVLCGPAGVLASAKAPTRHDDLPSSVRAALRGLREALRARHADAEALWADVGRVGLGSTLAVNALVQHKADRVALALSSGPGLDPRRFAIGEHVCIVPGGLDHRGVEVAPLLTDGLDAAVQRWKEAGVAAVACVGKFSPRNPAHEQRMAAQAAAAGLAADVGHVLSGQLNFPRRVATTYYNAAVRRILNAFLDAVEQELAREGIQAPVFLLKADGGTLPAAAARREPVQSILSGPAASVMGVAALQPSLGEDAASLLLDVGGTTTDIALYGQGSPVLDRDGMCIDGRRTLVRALATLSIGVGGDSLLTPRADGGIDVGPLREGPACAFGGTRPTLLDALNVDACRRGAPCAGDAGASQKAMTDFAATLKRSPEEAASLAVRTALTRMAAAAGELLERVNARPVYTLAALKGQRSLAPARAWLVGGPAAMLQPLLPAVLGMPVQCPAHADVANAVGAALALPTASLEVYATVTADSRRRLLRAPALEVCEPLPRSTTLDSVSVRAQELLREAMLRDAPGMEPVVEVLEADEFATLEDGHGSRDLRVCCQAVPRIARMGVQEE